MFVKMRNNSQAFMLDVTKSVAKDKAICYKQGYKTHICLQ